MNRAHCMAEIVADLSRGNMANAWHMGYGVRYDGARVVFSDHGVPVPKQISEKRNRAGRCTSAVYQYVDGSQLLFSWSDESGSRINWKGAP